MKIKPIVLSKIETSHTNYYVKFDLQYNITFINGDSGTGKSAAFSFIQELATEDRRIKCFNYLDIKKGYKSAIKQAKGKVFVIDNADILLDDGMRQYIAMDTENQYIVIGRNPTGLMLDKDAIFELASDKVGDRIILFLKKSFTF